MLVRRLQIDKFRSLRNVVVGKMNELVILHGPNNTGKSNILAALEVLFERKAVREEIKVAGETKIELREQNFWHGELEEFADNFFENKDDDITFEVLLQLKQEELPDIDDLIKILKPILASDHTRNFLDIKGSISMLPGGRGGMKVREVNLNKKTIFADAGGSVKYLPSIKGVSTEKAQETFEAVMGVLNGAFKVIPCNRYLTTEREMHEGDLPSLLPESFKNWLFRISLDREGHEVFQKIRKWFESEPFKYGGISFARIGNGIEIMVENKNGLRLPIQRLGSGVQQVLFLLSHIAWHKGKMVGIEELEINLSPKSQNDVLNRLDRFIRGTDAPLGQLMITSHSDHLGKRADVKRYKVDMDQTGRYTTVTKWSVAARREFFGR